MKIKTLVPFVVILALLAGLVVWQKANEAPPVPIATQVGLTKLAPDGLSQSDVSKVTLFSGTAPDEKVVLEREGESWRITTAYNAPVNQETLDGFLKMALALKGEPRAKDNTDEQLTAYDLKDDKAFHVQLFKSGAETPAMHVLFGKSADFRTVFVRKDGDKQVFVESTNLRREAGVSDSGESTTPQPTKWLKTTILEQPKEKIKRVAIQYPDKELVFERHEVVVENPAPGEGEGEGEGEAAAAPQTKIEWKLAQGGYAETYTDAEFQTLIGKFASLAVTSVVDPEQKAKWGFEPPTYKLTISRDDGDDIVLLGGHDKPGGDCYVQLQGAEPALIYQMAKFNFEQIFPLGSKLFALPAWDVAKDTITQVQIQRPDGNIVLVKEGEEWRVTEPAITLELQKTKIDSLVTALSSLKPVDYVDAGRDIGEFATTITITISDGQTRVLQLGAPSAHTDGCYAKFDGGDKVLAISRADMEKLNPPMRDFYNLSVMDFDQENVESIAVSLNDTELTLTRDAADKGKWQRKANGQEAEAVTSDVEEFIYTLNAFQVDNFLLDQTADMVQAVSTITVNQTGKEPVVISLSAESEGAYKVLISGLPYVFSVKTEEITNIVDDMQVFLAPPETASAEASAETPVEISAEPVPAAAPVVNAEPISVVIPTEPEAAPSPVVNAEPVSVVIPAEPEAAPAPAQ